MRKGELFFNKIDVINRYLVNYLTFDRESHRVTYCEVIDSHTDQDRE